MNENGTTLEFYDVGYPTTLGPCGSFSGSFDIDRNGNIEGFVVDALAAKEINRRFTMPNGKGPFFGDELFAYQLGNQIAADYDREIKDARLDMDISACERDWERIEAAE
ncbi:MAG: hypothetical protein JSR78_09135 [Proteobacteria bacterium]|nr:hypothetical protein [Pseudomonadota bacterium]